MKHRHEMGDFSTSGFPGNSARTATGSSMGKVGPHSLSIQPLCKRFRELTMISN